jgi:hypothetical protein
MKIKVRESDKIEDAIESIGAKHGQARVIGAVMRGIAGDILNERGSDTIRLCVNGVKYVLVLNKE